MLTRALLATVAAVAVIAGPALAQKQEAPPSRTEAPARAPSAIQNAPAEKVAPTAPKADEPSSTTGRATPGNEPADIEGGADMKAGSDTRPQNRTGIDSKRDR